MQGGAANTLLIHVLIATTAPPATLAATRAATRAATSTAATPAYIITTSTADVLTVLAAFIITTSLHATN